ncbi:MAG: GHKL domain-containing protein [Chlorobi bacterium]|nr:GHKL domain-containing protein [Chlorobiota bacterium]
MNNEKKLDFQWWLLIAVLLFFCFSGGVSHLVTTTSFSRIIIRHVEYKISKKEQFLNTWMEKILSGDGIKDRFHEESGKNIRKKLMDKEMALFIYEGDSLIFWSDNSIPLEKLYPVRPASPAIIFLGNGWFIPKIEQSNGYTVIGLILIKHHFPVMNKFLPQNFFRGSWLSKHYQILSVPGEGGMAVYNHQGKYCFSLKVKDSGTIQLFWNWFSFVLFFAGMILSFIWGIRFLRRNRHLKRLILSLIPVSIFIIYVVFLTGRILPSNFFSLPLFSPYYFALTTWCPSIGDLFFLTMLLFFLFYAIRIIWYEGSRKPARWITGLSFLLAALLLAGLTMLFYQLVMNSSLVFEPFRILDMNEYSVLGIFSVGFLFLAFLLITDVAIIFSRGMSARKIITIIIVVSLIFLVFLIPERVHVPWYTILLFWLSIAIIHWVRERSVSMAVFFIAFFMGVFSTVLILKYSGVRRDQNARLMAVNLAAERDPVAELLMEEINTPLLQDQELSVMMRKQGFSQTDVDQIFQYLKLRYFNGYWDKYELSVTLCNPEMDIFVDESPRPCFSFFQTFLEETGTPISGTKFYYLDTQNGLISYLAALYFPAVTQGDSNGLYIQLDSRILYEQLGYPELLLDQQGAREPVPAVFTYAKYYDGKLVAEKGDFPFPITDKVFPPSENEFSTRQFDGYRHIIYRPNGSTTMVMSYRLHRFPDYLISFSYLFVFFFLLIIIGLFRTVFPVGLNFRNLLLKQKIQLWIISLLFFIFLLVGAGTIFFSKKQFYENHLKNLKEKLQSVYVELEHKISFETSIDKNWHSPQYASLNDLLVKFSNVFYTDINLYNESGYLLATSRPEIFEKHLMSPRLNEEAYYQLKRKQMSEYVHRESIGKLTFLSAYTPFFNQDNKLLAYLNLPYFTKQNLLAREISNMIVGIINSWMVLILISFALAVFISDKITNPLRRIQEKIGKFKLGQQYEHIVYTGNDEIGGLVREYNRMIDELAKNIELLAKSERESAWREMARQIAHEIKNPLTPMKLSIQQLKRSWEDKREDFGEHMEQVTRTLVEQIDRLSKIATAFSNFARLPRTHYEPLPVVDVIGEVVHLFSGEHHIKFHYHQDNKDKLVVFADREEFNSVIVNLLKNAIQSIPEPQKGEINISISAEEGNKSVLLTVSDNGSGIPEGSGDRLFEPNFTTKSSGMGLGLAIVKKIIEDISGEIWYKPNETAGTSFFVRLPLYIPDEQENVDD